MLVADRRADEDLGPFLCGRGLIEQVAPFTPGYVQSMVSGTGLCPYATARRTFLCNFWKTAVAVESSAVGTDAADLGGRLMVEPSVLLDVRDLLVEPNEDFDLTVRPDCCPCTRRSEGEGD